MLLEKEIKRYQELRLKYERLIIENLEQLIKEARKTDERYKETDDLDLLWLRGTLATLEELRTQKKEALIAEKLLQRLVELDEREDLIDYLIRQKERFLDFG